MKIVASRISVAALALTLSAALGCGNVAPTPYNDFPPPPDYLTQVASGSAATATSAPAMPGGETAYVSYVVDGDTIDVDLNGQTYRVRYIGINTPERDQPCYKEATAANINLVWQQTVTLVRDVSETDPYGRLLRYIYVGETFVNAELVRQGWAEARDYPPDSAQAFTLDGLEADAAASGLGCWPSGVFQR